MAEESKRQFGGEGRDSQLAHAPIRERLAEASVVLGVISLLVMDLVSPALGIPIAALALLSGAAGVRSAKRTAAVIGMSIALVVIALVVFLAVGFWLSGELHF